MPTDEVMTEIVRRARCPRCDGTGFIVVPASDRPGIDRVVCQDCDGNGVKLGLCRRLAAELNGHL